MVEENACITPDLPGNLSTATGKERAERAETAAAAVEGPPTPPPLTPPTWIQSMDIPLPLNDKPEFMRSFTPEEDKMPRYRHFPKEFAPWPDFMTHALHFDLSPYKNRKWKESMRTPQHFTYAWARTAFNFNLRSFFRQSTLGSLNEPDSALHKKPSTKKLLGHAAYAIGTPELVAIAPKSNIMIGFVEEDLNGQLHLDSEDPSLLNCLNHERSLTDPTTRAVLQTVGYMLDNNCRCGALTTYRSTRFFFAESPDRILMSAEVRAEDVTCASPISVTLRRAFAYWLSLCVATPPMDFHATKCTFSDARRKRARSPVQTRAMSRRCLTSLKDSPGERSSAQTLFTTTAATTATATATATATVSTNAAEKQPALATCNASPSTKLSSAALRFRASVPLWEHPLFVAWSELTIICLIGEGRCGSVALAEWRGRRIALKLFDLKKGPTRFQVEFANHLMLERRKRAGQEVRVVELLLATMSLSGQVLGLGLQLGQQLPPFAQWSQQQREGAIEALRSLWEANLVQKDVRDSNFVQDDSGKVLAIDLEDFDFPRFQGSRHRYLKSALKALYDRAL